MSELIPYTNVDTINNNEVSVAKVVVHYVQGCDCEQEDDEVQELILESVDNGVAPFIRMHIPDNKFWSICGKEDIYKIVEDFEKRLNYKE